MRKKKYTPTHIYVTIYPLNNNTLYFGFSVLQKRDKLLAEINTLKLDNFKHDEYKFYRSRPL